MNYIKMGSINLSKTHSTHTHTILIWLRMNTADHPRHQTQHYRKATLYMHRYECNQPKQSIRSSWRDASPYHFSQSTQYHRPISIRWIVTQFLCQHCSLFTHSVCFIFAGCDAYHSTPDTHQLPPPIVLLFHVGHVHLSVTESKHINDTRISVNVFEAPSRLTWPIRGFKFNRVFGFSDFSRLRFRF